jgi:hypothetical protein
LVVFVKKAMALPMDVQRPAARVTRRARRTSSDMQGG